MCSFFGRFQRKQQYSEGSVFLILLVREYIQFIDFAYPELDATSKPNYTAVEGYDRHLKVFVPFFATVHNVVYTLLVEVLERMLPGSNFIWLKSFFCLSGVALHCRFIFCMFHRQLFFQVIRMIVFLLRRHKHMKFLYHPGS